MFFSATFLVKLGLRSLYNIHTINVKQPASRQSMVCCYASQYSHCLQRSDHLKQANAPTHIEKAKV